MPVTLIDSDQNSTTSASTLAVTLNSVTAGANLTCQVIQSASSAGRSYAISDSINGAWPAEIVGVVGDGTTNGPTSRHAHIYRFASSGAGDPVIAATVTGGAVAFAMGCYATTGDAAAAEDTGTDFNLSNDTTQTAMAAGFNVSAGAFVVGCIAPAASVVSATLEADYAGVYDSPATAPLGVIAHRIVGGSPVSDEQMLWTVGTGRTFLGVAASFAVAAAAAPSTESTMLLMGVG